MVASGYAERRLNEEKLKKSVRNHPEKVQKFNSNQLSGGLATRGWVKSKILHPKFMAAMYLMANFPKTYGTHKTDPLAEKGGSMGLLYLPRIQMTLVLTGKGLVLVGWPFGILQGALWLRSLIITSFVFIDHTGMSMLVSKWILTPIQIGCESGKWIISYK